MFAYKNYKGKREGLLTPILFLRLLVFQVWWTRRPHKVITRVICGTVLSDLIQ